MSEDLKTLKELKDYLLTYDRFGNTKEVEYYNKDVLRAEAIKWVKEIRSGYIFVAGKGKKNKKIEKDIVDWIMHFFNISEKDIKRSVEG